MRWGPGVCLAKNLVERFEVIRVPVDNVHRHPGPFAMLEIIVAIRYVFLVLHVTGRLVRCGRHFIEGGRGGTGIMAE